MKHACPAYDVVLVANGETPRGLSRQILLHARTLVACDGAARRTGRCGRLPDAIVGDGDSLADARRRKTSARNPGIPADIPVIRIAEQDDNDLAKAVAYVHQTWPDARSVAIVGAGGGREDHLLGNVFRLIGFERMLPGIALFTNAGRFDVVRKSRTFPCAPGDAVSVFAPRAGTHVVSEGLHWPLAGVNLDALYAGTLNRTDGTRFTVACDRPVLVYRAGGRSQARMAALSASATAPAFMPSSRRRTHAQR